MTPQQRSIFIVVAVVGIGMIIGIFTLALNPKVLPPGLNTVLTKDVSPKGLLNAVTGNTASTTETPGSPAAPAGGTTAPGSGTLQIGLMTLGKTATNAHSPLVTMTDQFKYTNTMDLSAGGKTVTFGFSALAGGYINYVAVKGVGIPAVEAGNLVNAGYGQGWQSTMRDRMHNLRYNPASVGFTAYRLGKDQLGAGSPVQLVDTKNSSIVVKQANVSLYQGEGKGYDFTQYEDLAMDNNKEDGGNTDEDLLPEVGYSQDDEIRSEFDYTGAYKNMSSVFGIPALQYDFAYAYIRPPKSILQFTNPAARDETGAPVYVPANRIADISPSTPGDQTLQPTDLSEVLPTSGIRVYPKTFTTVMWKDNGVWKSQASSPKGVDRVKVAACVLHPKVAGYKTLSTTPVYEEKTNCTLDNDVLITATSNNPDTAFAIALYSPQDMQMNAKQTWIVDSSTMGVISREDRRMEAFIGSTGGNGDIRSLISGMRSPTSLASAGYPHAFEMITQRSYYLFGTPNQIEDAIARFRASSAYASVAGE